MPPWADIHPFQSQLQVFGPTISLTKPQSKLTMVSLNKQLHPAHQDRPLTR